MATCSSDYIIYIWDITQVAPTPTFTLIGHTDRVFYVTNIPASTILLSTSND